MEHVCTVKKERHTFMRCLKGAAIPSPYDGDCVFKTLLQVSRGIAVKQKDNYSIVSEKL